MKSPLKFHNFVIIQLSVVTSPLNLAADAKNALNSYTRKVLAYFSLVYGLIAKSFVCLYAHKFFADYVSKNIYDRYFEFKCLRMAF